MSVGGAGVSEPDEREAWTGRSLFEFFEHEAERGRGWPRLSRLGKTHWDALAERIEREIAESAEARVQSLTEALAFYASQASWEKPPPPVAPHSEMKALEHDYRSPVERDEGENARAALRKGTQ